MDTVKLEEHTSRSFDEELEHIREQVLAMGGLVEQQIENSLKALVEANGQLAEQVTQNDYRVNGMEVEIDEACNRIIARRQPTAGDLRLVVAVIKTITDLERIGDEAEKIGYMALELCSHEHPRGQFAEIENLGRHVIEMVRGSLDAFARMDVSAALAVAKEDTKVDREYEGIMRQCITFMMEDPRTIRRMLDIMWSVRSLERIGDHARNTAEYVIYFVQGKDVRHISIEDMEKRVREEGLSTGSGSKGS